MIVLLIMRVGGIVVWSILVPLRLPIYLLVHHHYPLHIVDTVQGFHFIAHMDNKLPSGALSYHSTPPHHDQPPWRYDPLG